MTKEQNITLRMERRIRLCTRWKRMAANSGDSDLAEYWHGYVQGLLWAKTTVQPERIRLEALEQLRQVKKE